MSNPSGLVAIVALVECLRYPILVVVVQACGVARRRAANIRDEIDGHIASGKCNFFRTCDIRRDGEEGKGSVV